MTYTTTIHVPGQAKPARITIDVDPGDHDAIEPLMIAAIHADVKTGGHFQPEHSS